MMDSVNWDHGAQSQWMIATTRKPTKDTNQGEKRKIETSSRCIKMHPF